MQPNEVSHGDILVQIGELKGKVETLVTLIGQKREDMNSMFTRISLIEKTGATHADVEKANTRINSVEHDVNSRMSEVDKTLARWGGACLAISFLWPVFMPKVQSILGIIERDVAPQVQPKP